MAQPGDGYGNHTANHLAAANFSFEMVRLGGQVHRDNRHQ
jgi:hypothetical protein